MKDTAVVPAKKTGTAEEDCTDHAPNESVKSEKVTPEVDAKAVPVRGFRPLRQLALSRKEKARHTRAVNKIAQHCS